MTEEQNGARDLAFRCKCGHMERIARGVSPGTASRLFCHCPGCRTFAEGTDPGVLDEHGGTERIQVNPAAVRFAAGLDALRCVQQTPKGALCWIATCCDTPIGLTLTTNRIPFVGLDLNPVSAARHAGPRN